MPLYASVGRAASSALDPLSDSPFDFDAAAMPILATHWYGLRANVATLGIPDGNSPVQEAQAA